MIWFALTQNIGRTKTQRKLEGFRDLVPGWHYGQGGPIADPVLRAAHELYGTLLSLGFSRTNAFAGADGEVLLTAYHGPHYIALTVEPDLSFSLKHEEADNELAWVECVPMWNIKKALRETANKVWPATSGSSTPGTLILIVASSTTWRSRTLEAA